MRESALDPSAFLKQVKTILLKLICRSLHEHITFALVKQSSSCTQTLAFLYDLVSSELPSLILAPHQQTLWDRHIPAGHDRRSAGMRGVR